MAISIDIVSDSVCPWCYIGKRKLEAALAKRPNLTVEMRWHPFQLNPDMPEEGMDYREYYANKFGGKERSREIVEHIAKAGEAAGIAFRFDKIRISPNTLASHRLVRWAGSAGVQNEVVEAIFHAYFEDGRDIGDIDVLFEIARDEGMDADLVAKLFDEGRDIDLIKGEIAGAAQLGITGVPFFIIGRKLAVSGAQDPEVFLKALDRLAAEPVDQLEPIVT